MTQLFRLRVTLGLGGLAMIVAGAAVLQVAAWAQISPAGTTAAPRAGEPMGALAPPAGAAAPAVHDRTPEPYAAGGRSTPFQPTFTAKGELMRPTGWREWPFVGTPITPNGLNKPGAPFPEFHIVYIDPVGYEHYRRNGTFKDGTVMIKELTLVQTNATSDTIGSTKEASGRGYFMGEYSGLETSMKDSKRFPNAPGNWAYFSFGHVPEPMYKAVSAAEPVETCNACHHANAAEDYVFTQHYPVLRGLKAPVGR